MSAAAAGFSTFLSTGFVAGVLGLAGATAAGAAAGFVAEGAGGGVGLEAGAGAGVAGLGVEAAGVGAGAGVWDAELLAVLALLAFILDNAEVFAEEGVDAGVED